MIRRHLSLRAVLVLAVALSAVCEAASGEPLFVDRAPATGLDFVHFNGMSGEHYYPEMTGGGAALVDYDGDGDLDVFLVQGHMLGPNKTLADALFPPHYPAPLTDRLYRNDLHAGPGGELVLAFTDVTEASGVTVSRGYGMGVAAGDIDNDGFDDLYVANFGANQMLRNRGDGTFEDVTESAGTVDTKWSVGAAFFDYDRDGFLDLYVLNYVAATIANHQICPTMAGEPDYCGPLAYPPDVDRLFHNRGDGTFEEVTATALVDGEPGSSLGVVTGDFDGDGWLDFYVANDLMANDLWINQHDGTFRNDALLAGCAANAEGQYEASMGVSSGDFDNDGDEDLFMTHLSQQTNTLYQNDGRGVFADRSLETGVGNPSWSYTGFGTGFFDYDNDSWMDILAVNGAVHVIESLDHQGDPYPLHQPNQLYRNLGQGRFQDVTGEAGEVFQLSEVSRGSAFGDVDDDGDVDVVVVNNNGPVRLLINQVGQSAGWLGIELLVPEGRGALGTFTSVSRRGGPTLWRRVHTDGSFASSNDPRIVVGLAGTQPESLGISWLGGAEERWRGVPERCYLVRRQPAASRGGPE